MNKYIKYMGQFAGKYKHIIGLIIINIIFLSGIIIPDGTIIQRDFNFPLYNENFITYSTYMWNDLASQSNIEQTLRLFIRFPFILLAYFGVGIDIILKLMILVTYTFISISFFIFISEIFKISGFGNRNVAMIASLFFAYNPVSLQFSGGISLLFSLGILPLLLFLILRYQEVNNIKFVLLFSICLLFSIGHPFIFVMNIVISFLFSISIINSNIWSSIKKYFFITILFSSLFLWYIIPYISMGVSSVDIGHSSNLERRTFETVSDNTIYKILSLERDRFIYVNTFPTNEPHNLMHILSLGVLLAISFSVYLSGFRLFPIFIRRFILFVSIGYIFTSLLSLGIKSPIGELYWYFVSSTPIGFIIRSPLKFQLYQAFFLILLFIVSVSILLKKYNSISRSQYPLILLIVIFLGVSSYGIIDANTNSLKPINIPYQFFEINKILEEKNDTYKVMWYPRYNEIDTNWSKGHKIAAFDMKSSRKPTFNTATNYNFINYYLFDLPYKSKMFKTKEYYNFLLSISVKYIVFHNDRGYLIDNNTLKDIKAKSNMIYNKDNWYLFELKGKPANIIDARRNISLTEYVFRNASPTDGIINVSDIEHIKNKDIVTKIILTEYKGDTQITNYTKIKPTLWKVNVNTSKPFLLSFSETYDKLWEATVYIDGKKIEVIDPVPIYSVINGFWISETGNLEIVIRYKPQDWFDIGILISLIVLISCIGYTLYDWRINNK
ncbi:MAG: hypothetical protein OIN86_00905 [Candidatus Methanoperedens sp.]|nr:hypothetical protein [Candidatus Methanoperedens sp.]CAG0983256.1 hypothetical protein METP1_01891 [Methanosarcinales archaeon]